MRAGGAARQRASGVESSEARMEELWSSSLATLTLCFSACSHDVYSQLRSYIPEGFVAEDVSIGNRKFRTLSLVRSEFELAYML